MGKKSGGRFRYRRVFERPCCMNEFRATASNADLSRRAFFLSTWRHIAGSSQGGSNPSPIPHAHFVTTTTHKSLRAARRQSLLCKGKNLPSRSTRWFSLEFQGGPLMHVIAERPFVFTKRLQPQFRDYQRQVVVNARRSY